MPKEKKKSWFARHWIISIFLGLIVIGVFGVIFGGDDSNTTGNVVNEQNEIETQTTLITKSSEEMLPLPSELPTEYSIGEKTDITKESSVIVFGNGEEGFDSGKIFSISKYKAGMITVTDYIEITFGVYKFVDSDYSSNFYENVVSKTKDSGGYEQLSISANAECFAWKEDYGYSGGKIGSNICYNKNIVFWIDVSITNSFKKPDSYLKDMTKIVDKKVK